MITSAIAGFDQFERFLRVFDTLLKKEIGRIFQKIPSEWRAQASPDLNQLEESIRGTSKADLVAVINESDPMEGVAQ